MHVAPVKVATKVKIPEVTWHIQAGFPSPAEPHMENPIDLNDKLIDNPSSTFLVRVEGESMIGAGIYPGDVLVVDKAREARNNDVIVAILEGEFTVKRFAKKQNCAFLIAENPLFKPIKIDEHSDFQVWGVVTTVLHNPNPTSQQW